MDQVAKNVHGAARMKAVWGRGLRAVLAGALAVAGSACGEMTRQGTSSSYLVIAALEAASGAEPEEFGGTLQSDVITVVEGAAGIYNDLGRVTLRLGLKDPGTAEGPTEPTSANFITVERYRVTYTRADGRNVPGVDVPYPFDSAFTLTVGQSDASGGFQIVRHIAKQEAPLQALRTSNVLISTIAEVTLWGHDQTGREVSVSGRIGIDFGNFADPN
jgi:hypothetical protein